MPPFSNHTMGSAETLTSHGLRRSRQHWRYASLGLTTLFMGTLIALCTSKLGQAPSKLGILAQPRAEYIGKIIQQSSSITGSSCTVGNSLMANCDPGGPYVPLSKLVRINCFMLDGCKINAPPTTREYNFNLTYITSDLDGYNVNMIAINGLFPGPTIRCNTNDIVRTNVTNNLIEPTSMHWHRIYQRGTQWMDGVSGVSQCPILVSEFFIYEFNVTKQWGTFWYHSHYGLQFNDGNFGAFIVSSPDEPYLGQYTGDIIFIIRDYYHTFSNILTEAYISATTGSQQNNNVTVPDHGCAEGQPCRINTDIAKYSMPAKPWNCTSNCTSKCISNCKGGRFQATVMAKSTYRIRVLNAGAYNSLMFSVDGHELQIIEMDGNDVDVLYNEPQTVQSLAVAQRYSFLLTTNAKPGDYYIRPRIQSTYAFSCNEYAAQYGFKGTALAVFPYEGCGAEDTKVNHSTEWPDAVNDTCVDLDLSLLHPLPDIEVLNVSPDNSYTVDFTSVESGPLQRIFFNVMSRVPLIGDSTFLESQKEVVENSFHQGSVVYN